MGGSKVFIAYCSECVSVLAACVVSLENAVDIGLMVISHKEDGIKFDVIDGPVKVSVCTCGVNP